MAQFQQFLSAPGRTLYSNKKINTNLSLLNNSRLFATGTEHRVVSGVGSRWNITFSFFRLRPAEDTEQAILRAVTEKLISTISRWTKQGGVTSYGGRHIYFKQAAGDNQKLIVPIRWRSIFVTLSPRNLVDWSPAWLLMNAPRQSRSRPKSARNHSILILNYFSFHYKNIPGPKLGIINLKPSAAMRSRFPGSLRCFIKPENSPKELRTPSDICCSGTNGA